MIFPTVKFAIFFALVLPASWLLMRFRSPWKVLMVVASYIFYGFAGWSYCLLLGASTVANQAFAILIHRSRSEPVKRAWLVLAVAFNLGALAYYKYANLFISSSNNLFHDLGWHAKLPLANVALPAAISFFTFQALSYVIDTFRGKIEPSPTLDFAVYLSFFPHLLAGPIVRAAEYLPQLKTRRDPRRVDAGLAFWLIVGGLFKKLVIATYVAKYVGPVLHNPKTYSGPAVLLAVYAFAVQIYVDFSAYTDIAIGLAMLLGFRFPQNFDVPYRAVTLQEFWRRWHMTLSRWLRDYLYVPLGGNRRGRARGYVNLGATMVLGGLWHGASWMMLIWGAIHGVGLAIERFFQDLGKGRRQKRQARLERKERLLAALAPAGARGPAAEANGRQAVAFASSEPATAATGLLDRPESAGERAGGADSLAAPRHVFDQDLARTRPHPGPLVVDHPAPSVAEGGPAAPAFDGGGGGDDGLRRGDRRVSEGRPSSIGTWIRRIITFHVVCFAWIFFWQGIPGNEGNLQNALDTVRSIARWNTSGFDLNPVLVAVIVGALALQFTPPGLSAKLRAWFSELPWLGQGVLMALATLGTTLLFHKITPSGVAPFIYFKF